jgi:hypothetical protein
VIDVFVSTRRDADVPTGFFQQAIGSTRVRPVEVTTDKPPVYRAMLEALVPAAWHRTDQYANNGVESDHGRLKARLRPIGRLKQNRSARVIIAGMPSPRTFDVVTRIGGRGAGDSAGDGRVRRTRHGVTRAQGPVAYLLSAGAGLDVIGLRSWQLPPDILAAVIAEYPRLGFKREFAAAFRAEAARVPRGRVAFLRRYGAFDVAIKAAPFRG